MLYAWWRSKRLQPGFGRLHRKERLAARVRHSLPQTRFRKAGVDDQRDFVITSKNNAVRFRQQIGDVGRLRGDFAAIKQHAGNSARASQLSNENGEPSDIGIGFLDRPAAAGKGPDQPGSGIYRKMKDILRFIFAAAKDRIGDHVS